MDECSFDLREEFRVGSHYPVINSVVGTRSVIGDPNSVRFHDADVIIAHPDIADGFGRDIGLSGACDGNNRKLLFVEPVLQQPQEIDFHSVRR